jgi:hypothetical protein
MKRSGLLLLCSIIFIQSFAQNVGIGTSAPVARLHVTDSSVLFSAIGSLPVTPGNPPIAGAGRRMMWYADKAAFRVGYVDANQWNKDSIGNYSFAAGYDNKSKGEASLAFGYLTSASGNYSTAMGSGTSASGLYATAMGSSAAASGNYSIATGFSTSATGTFSITMGYFTSASGTLSTAMGRNTISKSFSGLVAGTFNDSTDAADPGNFNPLNRVFQIGNGTADNARSNALTVLQNGSIGIGTVTPLTKLHIKGGLLLDSTNGATPVSGAGTRLMWIPEKAAFRAGQVSNFKWDDINIGLNSMAFGKDVKASGTNSTSMGYFTTASGDISIAIGEGTTASGFASTAMGEATIASGDFSTAMGIGTITSGYASTAMGLGTMAIGEGTTAMGAETIASGYLSTAIGYSNKSKSFAGTVVGIYNDSTNAANPNNFNPLNRIFQIGNGTADNARSNAMTVLQNGNLGIGTTLPVARLHITDSSVLFSTVGVAAFPYGNPPISGAGRRMMWYTDKAAFRVGYVDGTQWDKDSIGIYSFATGYGCKSKGDYSIASGYGTSASGYISTVMGSNTSASGSNSTAMGSYTSASGGNSTAMGDVTTASGFNSIAMGNATIAIGENSIATGGYSMASGFSSTAMGQSTEASGSYSTTMGFITNASGESAIAMGYQNKSKSFAGTVLGIYNDSANAASPFSINSGNRIFQIGNGTADNARSNAMTVLQNGNVGINVLAPGSKLELRGGLGFSSTTKKWELNYDSTNTYFYIDEVGAAKRLYIKNGGNVGIANNNPLEKLDVTGNGKFSGDITVQSGKGLIRSNDGTQKKELTTTALVNTTIAAGASVAVSFTFPESFSSIPDVYVGNIVSGAGGWAEVIMSVSNITTTGGILYVNNPRAASWSPNYTVKIIAIGPQ